MLCPAAFSSNSGYTSRWMILVSASWRGMSCQNKTWRLMMHIKLQHTSVIIRHKTKIFFFFNAESTKHIWWASWCANVQKLWNINAPGKIKKKSSAFKAAEQKHHGIFHKKSLWSVYLSFTHWRSLALNWILCNNLPMHMPLEKQ